MSGGPLRRVTHYIWPSLVRPDEDQRVVAEKWWIGIIQEGKQRFIMVAPECEWMGLPSLQLLECGHEKQIPVSRGRQWYARRRRCPVCALEAL